MSGDEFAIDHAGHVLREDDAQTRVPPTFFDDLLDALDEPGDRTRR